MGSLLSAGMDQLWFAMPLVVVVSLVYAATRYEELGPIVWHAGRFAAWIVGFMGIVLGVLVLVARLV